MSLPANVIENNVLARFSGQASSAVVNAIKTASVSTGVDFAYLMKQAQVESNFNPEAKAKTSSASGLYQFIESTWMSMVERYGDKYGIDTKAPKKDILALRHDEDIAAGMAAELARENEKFLQSHWGGDIGQTELYLAHFMGAGGASSFLKARDENPLRPAADLFPAAARSNRNVFYDSKTGKPRSLDEVHQFFAKKFDNKALEADIRIAENAQKPVPYGKNSLGGKAGISLFVQKQPSPVSNYQQMLANPIELMLISQLEMPFGDKNKLSGFY